MPSFTLTGLSAAAQSLTGNQSGALTNADAQLIVTAGDAVTITGTTNYLTVNGTLMANDFSTGRAVVHTGTRFYAFVGPSGFVQSISDDAFDINHTSNFQLSNAGVIMADEDAVDITATDGSGAVSILNSGTIMGQSDAIVFETGLSSARILNSGDIIGRQNGIVANQSGASSGASYLNNSGTITGNYYSYDGSGPGSHVIYNGGLMAGPILLGDNRDRYDGPGVLLGFLRAGADDDTISGGAAADTFYGEDDDDLLVGRGGDDMLFGGAGDDMLLGGTGNDSMNGNGDDDTLVGNAGDDTMSGDEGNDILVGQDGADDMDGGDGNDTMDGGNGDDVLEGGADNDILRGRAGEDDLAGGLGRDFLTGGQDADTFVFRSLAETVVGANRDQILDFEQGVDLITVAGLSPGVFEFRGTAAFDPSGNPELRLFETPTGSTIVQIDADGDGIADAEIRVANVTGLTADDFLL